MEIWILVMILLVIAIVLFVASIYTTEEENLEEQLSEFETRQSQEIHSIKTRINELEMQMTPEAIEPFVDMETELYDNNTPFEVVELSEISDLTKEEVIRMYSQGATTQEIAHSVAVSVETVKMIIEDYIENR